MKFTCMPILYLLLAVPGETIFFNHFSTENVAISNSYDFIIVGSGSSGSVLANRLSEIHQWNILLLEVGKRPNIANQVPLISPALQFTDYSWGYKMEKTPGACLGMIDQRCRWPRGRGLGGSTLINYMIYTRGHRNDYDKWAAQGNPGWSYAEVLPYFLKSENVNLRYMDPEYHATGGPLSVEDVRFRNKIVESFIEGGRELGYPYVDYNGKTQDGFSYVQSNTYHGKRHSGYAAFIRPAEHRGNLQILTKSRVTKILIDPRTKIAYGVEFVKNRKYHYVNASKEIILSAGAFNSPQLLILSGIGPRSHLESLGIPVIQDLPVGRTMYDHIAFLGLFFQLNDSVVVDSKTLTSVGAFIDWFAKGEGPLTILGGVEALGYIYTNQSTDKLDVPDMELIFVSGQWDKDIADIMRMSFGIDDKNYDILFKPVIGKKLWTILPMHLKPQSVGYLELESKNPYHWPKLYGNPLSDRENYDVKAFIATIRFIQKLAKTNAFKKYGSEIERTPIPGCENILFDSDAYWECGLRHLCTTLHHQISTCKMGPQNDPTAVVDNELRVYGMQNLRVIDTSVIPFALNAHTNAPTYMIAEKASDFIKKVWNDNIPVNKSNKLRY